MLTAHLRCGDDLRDRLSPTGTYLAFADPVCQGPVGEPDLIAYLGRRARFIAAHYGADAEATRLRLGAEYMALNRLDRFDRVQLWFEHDMWDQAALIRVLGLLADRPELEGRLVLMPADGVRPFAALTEAELAALEPAPLKPAQREAGARAWAAFAAEDPRGLDTLRHETLPLPHLAAALRRHLEDLPWTLDGLSATERLVLRSIDDGARTPAAALATMLAADPVFQVTDLILLDHVARRLIEPDQPWRLSPRGEAVLRDGEQHLPTPRFLGGVTIAPHTPWRWDHRAGRVAEA
jgi:hypothetical protein